MLILSRNIGDSIRIGDDVELTILENDDHQVRIGITAPREVAVHREEIYLKIQAQSVEQAVIEVNGDR